MPFTKIAQKLKKFHETVRNKFERMKLNGIVQSCSINGDWSKLGYQGTMFVFISQKPGNEKMETIKELKKNSSIFLVNSVIGAYDLVAFSTLRDLKDFAKTVDYVQQIPGVGQVDVCFATFTYFSFSPIPRAPIQCDTLELSSEE
jgi:DNA-binding Lrp family transcriptional regulator